MSMSIQSVIGSLEHDARKARATKAPPLDALAFWTAHSAAVAGITAVYGARWRVAVPFGATEVVTLAPKLATLTTERGTKIKWGKDHRVPAARYWPAGMPDGVTVQADYPRHDPKAPAVRDDAWHLAHGYVWSAARSGFGLSDRKACWVTEVEARIEETRAEQREHDLRLKLEYAALTYGPQPLPPHFVDSADDFVYAETAD